MYYTLRLKMHDFSSGVKNYGGKVQVRLGEICDICKGKGPFQA